METNYALQEEVMRLRAATTNSRDFRQSLEKVGEYLALEIAPRLQHGKWGIETPMKESAQHDVVDDKIAIIGVLRAGLPLHKGLLNVYSNAQSGFIGAMRDEETLESKITYAALPQIGGKSVIIADTMLATGGTMCKTIAAVQEYKPKQVILASAIASKQGIERVSNFCDEQGYRDILIYAAAIDQKLNEKGYILPGLGDAGDRCYGRTV